jgi:hypothetical protein
MTPPTNKKPFCDNGRCFHAGIVPRQMAYRSPSLAPRILGVHTRSLIVALVRPEPNQSWLRIGRRSQACQCGNRKLGVSWTAVRVPPDRREERAGSCCMRGAASPWHLRLSLKLCNCHIGMHPTSKAFWYQHARTYFNMALAYRVRSSEDALVVPLATAPEAKKVEMHCIASAYVTSLATFIFPS